MNIQNIVANSNEIGFSYGQPVNQDDLNNRFHAIAIDEQRRMQLIALKAIIIDWLNDHAEEPDFNKFIDYNDYADIAEYVRPAIDDFCEAISYALMFS